ncbi:hypothetical protein ACHAWF_011654 [Thalassiosira exigua]
MQESYGRACPHTYASGSVCSSLTSIPGRLWPFVTYTLARMLLRMLVRPARDDDDNISRSSIVILFYMFVQGAVAVGQVNIDEFSSVGSFLLLALSLGVFACLCFFAFSNLAEADAVRGTWGVRLEPNEDVARNRIERESPSEQVDETARNGNIPRRNATRNLERQRGQRRLVGGRGYETGGGVKEEAKKEWSRHTWSDMMSEEGSTRSDYGSMSSTVQSTRGATENEAESLSMLEEGQLSEDPSCCICLCEYERRDLVISLPCRHIFHESCINSWTDNHVRCPLCNYDLMKN